MRVAISSGHAKDCRGASGYIDEVDEARLVVACVADYMESNGATVYEFHDDVSTSQSENLDRIIDFHNSKQRDLDVSVHFNAYEQTAKPMGTECLYVTQEKLAEDMAQALSVAGGFVYRGPKYRDDLAFLNGTTEPAILIEVCFVDSSADVELYHENFEAICRAIVSTILGEEIEPLPEPEPGPEPEPPEPEVRPTIGKGDEGEAVAFLQRSLGLPADGDFGSITEAGVQSFQGAQGLAKDGIVGPRTWEYIDELNRRVKEGDDGISDRLAVAVDELVKRSEDVWEINWTDRGKPPPGYYAGMAKTFALALDMYLKGNSAVELLGMPLASPEEDALTWYRDRFPAETNWAPGADMIRHLFVLMVGLGMRESSGNCWEGRDMSADNVEADTAEAGLFQTSWNINTCSTDINELLSMYSDDPNGFGATFRQGLSPTTAMLDSYGGGAGAFYQWLARYSPAFATLVTGIGLRLRRQHWGPINRHEAEVMPQVDEMLLKVQKLVTSQRSYRHATSDDRNLDLPAV